jgi:HEAT repeat protein
VQGSTVALEGLVGSDELVTVVIKERSAEDKNLRIVEVGADYLTALDNANERHTYLFDDIAAIRVQEGREREVRWQPGASVGMGPELRQVLERSVEVADEVFQSGQANQELKMDAASLLVVAGSVAQAEAALDYLQSIHTSNDLASAVSAAFRLYLADAENRIDPQVMDQALSSGNREIRAQAAELAGLTDYTAGELELYDMLRDRRADVSVPAAKALARMGREDIVPVLINMITERNIERGEAAVYGLQLLGQDDPEVASTLRGLLDEAEGLTRFRIARVLYAINHPDAPTILSDEIMPVPTLEMEAAIILAKNEDVPAKRVLRDRLAQRYDEVETTLMMRADMAAALVEGGDRTAVPILQEVLRTEFPEVKKHVCELIARLGIRSLATIIGPVLELEDRDVAMTACQAAVATVYADYRERLVSSWE